MRFMVKSNGEEFQRLLEALSRCGFHWISGQPANDPPTFLKRDKDSLAMSIHIINTDKRLIGYFPAEVYTVKEQRDFLAKAKDVSHALQFLSNHYHVFLWDLMESKNQKDTTKGFDDFSRQIQEYILQNYQIDLVEILNTSEKTISYIKTHSNHPQMVRMTCQNMEELYQSYLQQTTSLPQFADYIGLQLKNLAEEVKELENRQEAEEEQEL